ncbi:MAG: hypothetical protein RR936_08550 [Carnobacterium sp.]|uniref:hypothetical protein n=1 Tax=Carnobacterium TaxID=2747 RepID=UPI0028EA8949|nr:hypothetical protein [Carnobacterium maltaromaticum]
MNKLKVNLIGIFILATFMIAPTVIFANSVEIIEPLELIGDDLTDYYVPMYASYMDFFRN